MRLRGARLPDRHATTDLRSRVRRPVDRALARVGRVTLRDDRPSGVAVLAYHDVPDSDQFRAQLDLVAEFGSVTTASELAPAPRGRRPVAFTFDDGYRSVYDVAFPLLEERGWTATLFPVAGLADTDEPFWWVEVTTRLAHGATAASLPDDSPEALRYLKEIPDDERRRLIAELRGDRPMEVRQTQLSWDDIRELASAGWDIGNHSWSHPCLDRCTGRVIEDELDRAHRRLAQELGRAPTTLAYPNGNVDERVRRVAVELGYERAFLFDHALTRASEQDPLRLSRVRADATADIDRFTAILTGIHPLTHRLLRRA